MLAFVNPYRARHFYFWFILVAEHCMYMTALYRDIETRLVHSRMVGFHVITH